MNQSEVVQKVSQRSGVAIDDCEKVLKALEEVLGEEFSDSGSLGGAFDKVYRVMSFFKGKN